MATKEANNGEKRTNDLGSGRAGLAGTTGLGSAAFDFFDDFLSLSLAAFGGSDAAAAGGAAADTGFNNAPDLGRLATTDAGYG